MYDTAPTTEILVSITNVIRRSEYGRIFFPATEEGEERFDTWQKLILDTSDLVQKSWSDKSNICDESLETLEKIFMVTFPPLNKE
jgi:hypothetical protein